MSSPYVCRWGILATGSIADQFAKDLLADPSTRDVSDVKHSVVAVASSTSADRAKDFIKQINHPAPESAAAYGSYEELVKDKNVQIIYVATPHSHHYENCLLALEAGKHICCEKPFTVNAKQAQHLAKVAKAKGLFLMEAAWVRFFPSTLEIQRILHQEKALGKILRVYSDFAMPAKPDPKSRMFDPALAGGALLDMGHYALLWQMLILHQHPDNDATRPAILGSIIKHPLTGVDQHTAIILNFEKLGAQGIATTSLSASTTADHCVSVQGEKGELTLSWAPFRPKQFTLRLHKAEGIFMDGNYREGKFGPDKVTTIPIPGAGMFWEADACARALRDGKTEAELCTLENSILMMSIMDEVRRQGNFSYPDDIEAVRSDA